MSCVARACPQAPSARAPIRQYGRDRESNSRITSRNVASKSPVSEGSIEVVGQTRSHSLIPAGLSVKQLLQGLRVETRVMRGGPGTSNHQTEFREFKRLSNALGRGLGKIAVPQLGRNAVQAFRPPWERRRCEGQSRWPHRRKSSTEFPHHQLNP